MSNISCWNAAQNIEDALDGYEPDTRPAYEPPPAEAFLVEVLAELRRAQAKFPDSVLSLAALMEEVGELAQAMLKVRAGKWPAERVREEAIQVAVMAMRVALEGDRSFELVSYSEPDKPAACPVCGDPSCNDIYHPPV